MCAGGGYPAPSFCELVMNFQIVGCGGGMSWLRVHSFSTKPIHTLHIKCATFPMQTAYKGCVCVWGGGGGGAIRERI